MGIFIGNLQPGTTTSDLLDFIGDQEGVTDIEIVTRRSDQGEVRFGHILFRSPEDAERAMKLHQQKSLYGSMVLVREFVDRSESERRSTGLDAETERRLTDRRYSPDSS